MIKQRLIEKILLLLFCFSNLCFTRCGKDKTSKAVLPAISQEGKNTIGFTINDEVWVPYAKCGGFSNPCGEMHVEYGPPAVPSGVLGFGFTRKNGDRRSDLTISSGISETITSIGDKVDSINVEYSDNVLSTDGYFVGPQPGSQFVITKNDPQNQIISGEFELVLRERKNVGTVTNNIITLKSGRFDFKFNVCKCTQ
jgi:hypothetical protein